LSYFREEVLNLGCSITVDTQQKVKKKRGCGQVNRKTSHALTHHYTESYFEKKIWDEWNISSASETNVETSTYDKKQRFMAKHPTLQHRETVLRV
jgi:hypothetical protein